MTEANYSNGDYYHYTYDAVGNRLTQQTSLGTTNYVYDNANRLTTLGSVSYTWDNNGNLLNDGTNAYTYDSANRLISFNGQGVNATYSYNGLNDRLQQIVNGNATTYALDLNAGLTQVLNDGTNQYLYGVGRIAQVNTTTEYFLGDVLGSVRQLTNATGDVTLAKSYQPYGETLSSAGIATSSFAFTGEQQDASGLTYLRARYYASNTGRFISRDIWMGDYNSPLSLNRWMYVEGNPINRTDPSGMCWVIDDSRGDGIWYPDNNYLCVRQRQIHRLTAPALSIPSYPDDTGYSPAQDILHYNDEGEEDGTYYNLCGLVGAEIILEAITGRRYDIRDVMKFNDTWVPNKKKDHGLGIGGEGDLLAATLGNRADVIGYYGMSQYYFHGTVNNRITVALARNWDKGLNLLNVMDGWIRRGAKVTVTGILNQDKPSSANPDGRHMANHAESVVLPGEHMTYVSHWVVVQSINGDWITIVNPFYNRLETYSWPNVFQGSMSQNGNTVICVDPTKTGICDLNLPKAK